MCSYCLIVVVVVVISLQRYIHDFLFSFGGRSGSDFLEIYFGKSGMKPDNVENVYGFLSNQSHLSFSGKRLSRKTESLVMLELHVLSLSMGLVFGSMNKNLGQRSGITSLHSEMAVNIQTGCIVWICGPFPCGSFNDLTSSVGD